MNIYFDTEFTHLGQDTELISIGLVTDRGNTFYGEIHDYDQSKTSDFTKEFVIPKLILTDFDVYENYFPYSTEVTFGGLKTSVSQALYHWLNLQTEELRQDEKIHMWADCLAYDWVLFLDLIENDLPEKILYIPFDLSTLLLVNNIDPDISREEFANYDNKDMKHTALFDAQIIRACVKRIYRNVQI